MSEHREPSGVKYNLSVAKWNSKFGGFKRRRLLHYITLWVDGDIITVHHHYTILGKIIMTLLYPFMLIDEGYGEAYRKVRRAWCNKTSGICGVNEFYRGSFLNWKVLEEMVGCKL